MERKTLEKTDMVTSLLESSISLQWIGRAMESVGDTLDPEGPAYLTHMVGERIYEVACNLESAGIDDFLKSKECNQGAIQPQEEGGMQ
jgi:hypothetical protein